MAELHPIHSSLLKHRSVSDARLRPHNMDRIAISHEQRQVLEELVLGIFADMTNAGCTLHETLVAIYVSGAKHMAETQASNH